MIKKIKSFFINNFSNANQKPDNKFLYTTQEIRNITQENTQIQSEVLQNRYSYFKYGFANAVNKIAKTSSCIDYIISENGEQKTSITTNNINKLLTNPSARQQTYQQLCTNTIQEYLINGIFYWLYNFEEGTLKCLNSKELTAINSITKYITSYQLTMQEDKYKTYFENFELDLYERVYYNKDKTMMIYASDIEFENQYDCGSLNLSKSPINSLYSNIFIQQAVMTKNQALIKNKNEGDLLFITSGKGIMKEEEKDALSNQIQEKLSNVNINGQPKSIFLNGAEISVNKVSLNDGIFNSQFMDLFQEQNKEIYKFYGIPIEKGVEQAKYSNAEISSIDYLEQAIKPNLDFYYSCLSFFLKKIFKLKTTIELKANYNELNIVKSYMADYVIKIGNFLTDNEVREKLGYGPTEGGDKINSQKTTEDNFDI